MIAVLSPAKTLATDVRYEGPSSSLLFPDKAAYLAGKLAKYSPVKLAKVFKVSTDLARLNAERYAAWQWPYEAGTATPALILFKGDVYQALDAETLSSQQLEFAQKHLRILSGLYGLLRPLDLILPYRLEMGTPLQVTPKTKGLYAYWKSAVRLAIESELKAHDEPVLVNLASEEYAKVLQPAQFNGRWLQIDFKEERNNTFQTIGLFAKKARGLMARYMLENNIDQASGLADFNWDGYSLNKKLSSNNTLTFTRKTK